MIRLTRRAVLSAAAVMPAFAARAQNDVEPISAQGGEKAGGAAIDAPLRELYSSLETAMKAGRSTPFKQRFDALAPVVEKVFDLETILKVSIGMRWDTIPPASQTRLLDVFRRFTVATYVANFDRYDGEHFRLLPGVRDLGTDRIVGSDIEGGGQTMRVDYVMRDGHGSWRVVDVLLDGAISRVAVQRSDFRKILAGGDADALIASLQRKISDLSDGALSS
jgi:phospholipid transport system substrate-binding protein